MRWPFRRRTPVVEPEPARKFVEGFGPEETKGTVSRCGASAAFDGVREQCREPADHEGYHSVRVGENEMRWPQQCSSVFFEGVAEMPRRCQLGAGHDGIHTDGAARWHD